MYRWMRKLLQGYTDTDRSMSKDWKAISGYAFLIDCGTMSWALKKQEIVLLLATESEYIAAMHTMKEALWLCLFIGEVLVPLNEPITLFSDNQFAITLTKDHQYHAHTKHIDIHFHFIHWVVDNSKIHLVFCPTNDMVTNTLTKALPSPKVKHFTAKLRLHMA